MASWEFSELWSFIADINRPKLQHLRCFSHQVEGMSEGTESNEGHEERRAQTAYGGKAWRRAAERVEEKDMV